MSRRSLTTSFLASLMLAQTRVPTSTTDWCISALTRSCNRSLPFSIISAWICERRSRVTGSTVWYSSSIPMVKVGFIYRYSSNETVKTVYPVGPAVVFGPQSHFSAFFAEVLSELCATTEGPPPWLSCEQQAYRLSELR